MSNAARTAEQFRVGTLVRTHMIPPNQPEAEQEWIDRAANDFGGVMVLAEDLTTVEVALRVSRLRYGSANMKDDPLEMESPDQEPVEESEPDARFTYANERTFLAWNRTALALIATGVAATQLLPEFHIRGGRQILGIPLIALGALVAITSFTQWKANERAMRRRQPLPKSPMALVLAIGIGFISVIAIVLVFRGPR